MMLRFFIALALFGSSITAQAYEWNDPTEGKAFVPWLWEDQFLPTIKTATTPQNLYVLLGGAGATVLAHQYDDTARRHNLNPDNRIFTTDEANFGAWLGSGGPFIAIAIGQIFLDQENGLKHGRAIALTAASHITIAASVQRHRPNEQNYLSFPSGHASSVFATATSLAYSYGWMVGVPAYLAASYVAATRVSENIHWTSDVVAGAALGIFWGRASALTDTKKPDDYTIMPIPMPGGMMISFDKSF